MSTVAVPTALDRVRVLVRPAMEDAVRTLSPEVRRIAEYHLGFRDADGRPAAGGGKAVRPALAVLSAEAVGGTADDAIPGAVAVELVHDFSLLHDDVMDEDEERRHRPTAWTVFGIGPAVLAGDALLALATRVLIDEPTDARLRAADLLNRATAELIVGQGADLEFEGRARISVVDCLEMESGKTGALLAASCGIGALLAGAPQELVARLHGFGRHLGLAFQAVDDLLGIWGAPDVTGKPRGSDLRQRKKTLPVVAAIEHGGEAAAELARMMSGAQELTDRDVARAAAVVEAAGGRAFAEEEARRQLGLARQMLDDPRFVPGPVGELEQLARFVVERER